MIPTADTIRRVMRMPAPSIRDVIAGISVALILIPQSLAYAEIAGVPSYIGLYAAALPPLAAALFASSPYLQTGPVAMTALLTFGALSGIAAPGTAEYVKLAALLAIMVGVIRVVLGIMRTGVIAYFMSQPVLLGFTSGAAILILASQVPTAFGSPAPEGKLLYRAGWTLLHPGTWEPQAIALSVVTVAVVLGGRRLGPLVPGVLVAVLIGIGFSSFGDYSGATVGDIPAGLPPFSLALPWGDTALLLIGAVVIALVGFAEPAAIARTYATQDRMRWSPNQEFLSQGVANLAAGISGGFPVGGSFSRTSVNRLAGGRTRWSGAVTGIAVFAFLPIAGVLSPLPRATLAAIVIAAVARLVRIDQIVRIRHFSPVQAGVAGATFVATLVLSPRIDIAVLLGIGLGVAVHLVRELRATVEVGYEHGTLRLGLIGVMYFGSTPAVEEALVAALADHPEATNLVIDLEQVGRIDFTGAMALKTVTDDGRDAGIDVRIVNVPAHARRIIGTVFEADTFSPQPGA